VRRGVVAGVTGELAPLDSDGPGTEALAVDAARARTDEGEDPAEVARSTVARVRSGAFTGRLWRERGRTLGIALWGPPDVIGITVRFVFIAPGPSRGETYRSMLDSLTRSFAPVAFVPPLPGIPPDEESAVMEGLGFEPFRRTEMRIPDSAALPPLELGNGLEIRPVRASDEPALARLRDHAFSRHFDRYLFVEDLDPRKDSERAVRTLLAGEWGEFLPWASRVAESAGGVVGDALVIRSEGRALIADVAVEPAQQGRGIGRRLVTDAVTALRHRGERVIALAVTEENTRAVRLYERLGFVRALGPERRWYNPRVVPVRPGAD
jgi:ribosomal protein S18 acetylase RimI-like enzyme